MRINTDFLPKPFNKDIYHQVLEGIYDEPEVNVYVNQDNDFAFLYPQPQKTYENYEPRYKKLNLLKKNDILAFTRFQKISYLFTREIQNVLEIGASEGHFLSTVKQECPWIQLAAVEPDQNSFTALNSIITSENVYEDITHIEEEFDIICLFHVLEHIITPNTFLHEIKKLTHSATTLIVEVPSLFDPLLSLYNCQSYQNFYFQAQHPYVYSHLSLPRLMEHNGFQTIKTLSFQRYGIDNHLNWLANNSPGGDKHLKSLFQETNNNYILELEFHNKTDSVIWLGCAR